MPNTSYRKYGSYSTSSRSPSHSHAGSYNPRSYAPTQFKNASKCIQQSIGSFRNIATQFNGAGKVTAFSPTTVNKWIKYVNDGTFVYKFTNEQFRRYFGARFNMPTNPNYAARVLKNRYGAGIKDVARGKGGSWLVAASGSMSSGPFKNYKW